MKLFDLVDKLIIPSAKITHYLLSEENSGGKSTFWFSFGFSMSTWQTLEQALLHHATMHDIKQHTDNPYGIKYIIEGKLNTPDDRNPLVRAIWIVGDNPQIARFVTAYPIKE